MATSACRERPVRSTLSFNTFQENVNTLRQTSSEGHSVHRGRSAFWKVFKKPVAPVGYKNKQCRKQTSVLSGRTVTAYVPLRSATERERAAFLIPCQGLRGLDTIFFTNFLWQGTLTHPLKGKENYPE